MRDLRESIDIFVDPVPNPIDPVRIAILDSGFDRDNPFLFTEEKRIKGVQNFIDDVRSQDVQDEAGHGTHALGLLLKVAPCAEIYVAKIAERDVEGPSVYDGIAKVRPSSYQSRHIGLS